MAKGVVAVVLALAALSASPARAQTLAQKQMMTRQDAQLAEELPSVNKACGTDMTASISWPSFLQADTTDKSVSSFCAEALRTIRGMCSDPTAKQVIAEKVKSYQCTLGGPGKRSLALNGTTLSMAVDWDAANYDDYIKAWLGDHL